MENTRFLKTGLTQLGLDLPESPQRVAAFSLGSTEENQRVHEALLQEGILLPYSRYVGAGDSGVLRAVVFSSHTEPQLTLLLDMLSVHIRT